MYDCFRPGDVVRAEVISLGDARSYYLSTAKVSDYKGDWMLCSGDACRGRIARGRTELLLVNSKGA